MESAGTEQYSPTLTRRISVELAFKISICQLSYRVTETLTSATFLAACREDHTSCLDFRHPSCNSNGIVSALCNGRDTFRPIFSSTGVRNSLFEFCAQLSFNNKGSTNRWLEISSHTVFGFLSEYLDKNNNGNLTRSTMLNAHSNYNTHNVHRDGKSYKQFAIISIPASALSLLQTKHAWIIRVHALRIRSSSVTIRRTFVLSVLAKAL